MSEEEVPYLVENKERDTFTIYIKGTKPYLELQQKLEDCEQAGLTEHGIATMYKERIDKAIEYIESHWIEYEEAKYIKMNWDELEIPIEEIAELLEILGDKE